MWYELKICQVNPNLVETLSESLEEQGALSITWTDQNDDPILEPAPGSLPLWPEVQLTALFETQEEAELVQRTVSHSYPDLSSSIHTLMDQAWERVCMDQFQPQAFGSSLWICPSWCEPTNPEAVNVILDPGLAFGTGTHATTALCLEWLDKNHPLDKNVIDFGCGSGILAIAARKLGAHTVYAVDIDPQALEASAYNAEKNACLDQQFIIQSPEDLNTPCDLLIANILLTPLQTLKNRFDALLKTAGKLVISGILAEQAEALISTYQPVFKCLEQHQKEEWALLVFTR